MNGFQLATSVQARLHSVRIGIVDDNIHMARIIQQMFRGFGVLQSEIWSDAATAVSACKDIELDLIVLDYHMETIDGIDFTRLLRKNTSSRNALTPILLVSAFTEAWRVKAARDAGVTEVCAKPLSARELWVKFAVIANQPRPFIRAGDFFGPDRRRRFDPVSHCDRRRNTGEPEMIEAPITQEHKSRDAA
eukprot:Skav204200  [mRNA]  locus=scaffold7661:126:698:- [translate_table: standard]